MEILQNGKKVTKKKRFSCEACGCVFEAERGEYTEADYMEWNHDIIAKCRCPYCGETVYSWD